eukprot:220420-Rhodomonas_salina.1
MTASEEVAAKAQVTSEITEFRELLPMTVAVLFNPLPKMEGGCFDQASLSTVECDVEKQETTRETMTNLSSKPEGVCKLHHLRTAVAAMDCASSSSAPELV